MVLVDLVVRFVRLMAFVEAELVLAHVVTWVELLGGGCWHWRLRLVIAVAGNVLVADSMKQIVTGEIGWNQSIQISMAHRCWMAVGIADNDE